MADSRKVDSIRILLENRKNSGGSAAEPANFSPDVRTDVGLYNFGSGFSEKALLPDAPKPLYATHISHNNQNYSLSLAQSGNAPNAKGIDSIRGDGKLVELNGGEKVDIQRWTICANPRF
ncbi:hypothetical protein E8E11_002151 [Didymella keratinophila]|nr:hypothetical protein E8E11_002151 [Didymella keratinophila]